MQTNLEAQVQTHCKGLQCFYPLIYLPLHFSMQNGWDQMLISTMAQTDVTVLMGTCLQKTHTYLVDNTSHHIRQMVKFMLFGQN